MLTDQVASCLPEHPRQDLLGSAVRVVCEHATPRQSRFPPRAPMQEFRQGNIKLLDSDKRGMFGILKEGAFADKANDVLRKNFGPLKMRHSGRLGSREKEFSSSMNLTSLKSVIGGPAKPYLSVSFTAKIHKDGVPFRGIILEIGCWRKPLGRYPQKTFV